MLLKFIFSLFILSTAVSAVNAETNVRDKLDPRFKLLREHALPIPQPVAGEPLVVNTSAKILSTYFDTDKYEFEMTLVLSQQWKDPLLAYDPNDTSLNSLKYPASVWTPDVFFLNNLMQETIKDGNITGYIKRYPDGTVYEVERKTVKTSCRACIGILFPMQICKVNIESFGYPVQDLVLVWNKTEGKVEITEQVMTPDYVALVEAGVEITTYHGEDYSSLWIVFFVSKTSSAVIFRVIMPIAVIAICSWTSYIFTRDELCIRCSVCISPILTYLLQINSCTGFFISPSYLSGFTVWAVTSVTAMFVSGVECFMILCKKGNKKSSRRGSQAGDGNEADEEENRSHFYAKLSAAFAIAGLDLVPILAVFLSRTL